MLGNARGGRGENGRVKRIVFIVRAQKRAADNGFAERVAADEIICAG